MQFLLIVFSLLPVEAVPLPSQAETLDWVASPTSRGTITILFSCAAALCLCVWTGVHLNVEPIEHRRKKIGSQFLGKLIWALIALFAPDIVLSVALHQFLVAWEYRRAVNDLSKKKKKMATDGAPKPKKLKLGMAFFAVMGGFCGEVNTVDGPRWDSLGVVTLCHWRTMESIREYSLSEIKDKSKASAVAKTLACVQTAWLLLQCFGREAERLHITLLELNTAVHIVLAIVMYGIWWEKPLDIRQSIPFDRSRLGIENSPTTVYVDTVRSALEHAEREVAYLVAPNCETEKENQVVHPEILVAVSIFRSIRGAPEEAGRMFRIVPNAIRMYFQNVIRADIRHALMQNYKRSAMVSASASQAAYVAAFAVASEIAFQVAHAEIFSTVYKLAAESVNSDKGTEEFVKALTKAYEATRKATFKTSFDAAFAAVVVEAGRKNTISSFGSVNKQPRPSGAQQSATPHISLLASFRAANSAARSASRHAVRLVAFDAALGIAGATNAATAAFRNVAAEACGANINEPIKAYATSAAIQTREVGGNSTMKGSIEAGILSITKKSLKMGGISTVKERIEAGIGSATETAREAAAKTLNEQFCTSGPRVSSGVSSAVAVVKRSTSTGVFFAALDAIRKAKHAEKHNPEAKAACARAEDELIEIAPAENESKWQRLRTTAHDVVGHQVITVPGLFGPKATEDIKRISGGEDRKIKDQNGGAEDNGESVFGSSWRKFHRTILIIFSAIAGAFYGTIHATKWNSHWFATDIERRLWQISCVVGSAAMIPFAILLLAPFVRNERFRHLAMAFCAICWIAFTFARMYLVFESFLSLRSLPQDAFEAVQWANAIPHI